MINITQAILVFVLVVTMPSCVGQHALNPLQANKHNDKEVLAKIEKGKVIFIIDTLKFKKSLSVELFEGKNIVLNNMAIKKQAALVSGSEFYYLLLKDHNNSVKVARWLDKIGDSFYFSNENIEKDSFPYIYIICYGKTECDPEMLENAGTRFWGCTKDLICPATVGTDPPKCLAEQSLMLSE